MDFVSVRNVALSNRMKQGCHAEKKNVPSAGQRWSENALTIIS